MRVFILIFFIVFIGAAQAQKPRPLTKKTAQTANAAKSETAAAARFEAVKIIENPIERSAALEKFIKDFPRSPLAVTAGEMLVSVNAELGEVGFRQSDANGGANRFRQAVKAFQPQMSDQIFDDYVIKLPFNLFFRNDRATALELARIIETKISDNPPRLLALAKFYLTIEDAAAAKKLAARATQLAPNSADAAQVAGLAQRIDLQLDAAATYFQRAVELDPNSATAKRNLADALRGLGQADEAVKLYRELLAANPNDEAANNGLILALFDVNKSAEAEPMLTAALAANPKNLLLATAAAYWYAAHNEPTKAADLAQKAVAVEPRFVWAQIALARARVAQRQPLEAERALIFAKQFGNFPTLDYELANAHLAAGLYDEARDDLQKSFALNNGKLQTKLANRVDVQADDFNELLARERRAGIFQFDAAGSADEAQKLRQLLIFSDALKQPANNETAAKAAAEFAAGDDEASSHRDIYAANKLLDNKIALPSVLELTQKAVDNLNKSLDAPAPSAAVLAEELYEPRRLAQTRGEILNVPNVEPAVLSRILRGRVEEIMGWTMFQQQNYVDAIVHLRRAVGVLPANSAWWRSSNWRLGTALEANGNLPDALEAYLRSYRDAAPNETRLVIIKAVYQRLNNNSLDGFDAKLNNVSAANPAQTLAKSSVPTPTPFKNPLPEVVAQVLPKETPAPTPKIEPTPEVKAAPEPTPTPKVEPAITPMPIIAPPQVAETKAQPTPQPTPKDNVTKTVIVVKSSAPTVEIAPGGKTDAPKPEPSPKPNAEAVAVNSAPESQPAPKVENGGATTAETTGLTRPRVVIRSINPPLPELKPVAAETKTAPQCTMEIDRQPLSVLRNGGIVGLLVTFSDAASASELRFSSNSPNDVRIESDTTASATDNKRLLQIKSVSEVTKIFEITVESPCGRQTVELKVR